MEVYIMCQAGGTEKYLVMIHKSAYETYGTLDHIAHAIFDSWHVQMHDLTTCIEPIYDIIIEENYIIVDAQGIHPAFPTYLSIVGNELNISLAKISDILGVD